MDTNLGEGNIADKVSQMMHFVGEDGSIQITTENIKEWAKQLKISVDLMETLIKEYVESGNLPDGFVVKLNEELTTLSDTADKASEKIENVKARVEEQKEAETIVIDPDEEIVIDPDKVVKAEDIMDVKPEDIAEQAKKAFDEAAQIVDLSPFKEKISEGISSVGSMLKNIISPKENSMYSEPIGPMPVKESVTYEEPIGPVQETQTKQISASFVLNQDNTSDIFEQLQLYADSHGIKLTITGENQDVKDKVDEGFDYRKGDSYTITLEGEAGESFDKTQQKTESLIGLVTGDYKFGFGVDEDVETNLDNVNTKIDDTQANAEEETSLNIPTEDTMSNLTNVESEVKAIHELVSSGSSYAVSITGDDPHQLLNTLTQIDDNCV